MTVFGKLIFGAVALLLVGGIYYGVSSYVAHEDALVAEIATSTEEVQVSTSTDITASSTELMTASSSTDKPKEKKIPFTELLKKGGSYVCAVNQSISTMNTTGTVYIDGTRIKASFSTSISGQTIDSTMIKKDGYVYTWTNNSKGAGNKIKVVDPKTANANQGKSGALIWDGSQVGDYNCADWKADEATFEVPKDVTFTEIKQ